MFRAFAVVDTSEVESFCFFKVRVPRYAPLFIQLHSQHSIQRHTKVIKSSTIANEDLSELGRLGRFSSIFGIIEPFVIFKRWLTKRVTQR